MYPYHLSLNHLIEKCLGCAADYITEINGLYAGLQGKHGFPYKYCDKQTPLGKEGIDYQLCLGNCTEWKWSRVLTLTKWLLRSLTVD